MDFKNTEKQFKQLKAQFEAGTLTESKFKAQLEELMIQDEKGQWWMIGYETERWYRHDGTAWVQSALPDQHSQKIVAFPRWTSTFWIITGWSLGFAIGMAVFNSMGKGIALDTRLAIGGAVCGAAGGLVTGSILRTENVLSNWKNVLYVTLAWLISCAIGWTNGTAINLAIGGFVTAIFLRIENMLPDLESILFVTLAWTFGSATGGVVNETIAETTNNLVVGAVIGGAIGGAIGGFVMIWQVRSNKAKQQAK